MAVNWTSVFEGRLHTLSNDPYVGCLQPHSIGCNGGVYFHATKYLPGRCVSLTEFCRFFVVVMLLQDIKAVSTRLIFVTSFSPSPQPRYFVSYYFSFPRPIIQSSSHMPFVAKQPSSSRSIIKLSAWIPYLLNSAELILSTEQFT